MGRLKSSRTIESCSGTAPLEALPLWGTVRAGSGAREAGSAASPGTRWPRRRWEASVPLRFFTRGSGARPQKNLGMDEEGVRQPSGPPTRKKFFIPLEEEEAPPAGVKPLFKSTRSLPTVETSPQAAPQTYAEYAISGPQGGAGAPQPPGPELLAGETANQAPKPGAKSSSIIVSPRQRGNPVLKFVRNVPWEFGDVLPDYVLGQSTCALFLSLRYHNLHPDYIHERLQSLGKSFALRVLLVQVDVKDPQQALKELAKMCILADCTLVLAWSPEEAGRYLETYKAYEQKPADLLMEKLEQDFVSRVTECLTTVKSVNKTDSQTLLTTFGSLEQLMAASREDLALCPGLGPQKARRVFDVLHEPFLKVPR
ncbi:DNA excision repair protein ERCC-1 isoform X3 [Lutra lutra]|uniref:DNA excision repair protein ERCC-1 isoform X3 n=1 Tax=Lutra lutra TaxID=9657 RepID=UPI001FD45FB9|nr:DNA excision repair protein ERCC-1 isoform X3 [Lutra lutra]